ncbi:MAG: hypothetical protein ACJA0X_003327 [Cyclobacteriaceae bacterium]|jgi:hypothetical protein
MTKYYILLLTTLVLSSCYVTTDIPQFDQEKWLKGIQNCDDSLVSLAEIIVANDTLLLTSGQAIIKQLLGQPAENELYNRNQKFFHYNLTGDDSCANVEKQLRLSIRFDALDRAKEFIILEN